MAAKRSVQIDGATLTESAQTAKQLELPLRVEGV
jgi:hypothetical protein